MALLASVLAFGQNITVTGVVSDSSTGEPVPYASIQLQGTMTGASADGNGNYTISVPANGTLIFSSIGYITVEEPIGGRTVHNVALDPDSEALAETIVVAFGTATKESFTGSAKVVGSDELQKSQVGNVVSALAGQVAGVQMTSSNGAPGSSPSLRIRGYSSISAGKEPLYVVDGMPYDGDLNNINPSDVESMTVLKDAASNALYGARGANGVIMITTKRAKEKDAVITFEGKVGVNTKALIEYETIQNPAAYYEAHYEALKNYYISQGYSAEAANIAVNNVITGPQAAGGLGYQVYDYPAGQLFIGMNGKLNPNATLGRVVGDYYLTPDNWADEAYRNSVRQEYNLSVAGGTEKSNIFASIGYLDNQGITANSDMQRLTARLKTDYQAKEWLNISGNMSYTNFNYNSLSNNGTSNSTGNVWAYTSQIAPIYPLYVRNADGSKKIDANGITMMDYGDGMNAGLSRPFMQNGNALLANMLNTRNSEGNAFSAAGAADISFLEHFKFTINASTAIDESRGTTVQNPYYGQFASAGGTLGKSHSRTYSFNTQQLLNYTQSFGRHNLNVMVGHDFYDLKSAYLYASKQKMFSQDNKELDGAVVDNASASSYTGEYMTEGFISRAQYDYDAKIFLSASFRRDASTHFAPEYQWGNFWSAGGAWIISKEPWFHASWVDMLKLKASIGQQGNDDIGTYRYTDTYSIQPSDGEVSVVFDSKGKRDISWEKITNFNAGIEYTLFDGIIDGSFEYFDRRTKDMLFQFSVAPSNGYSSYYDNVGDLYNRGFEIGLNLNLINSRDVQWNVNFNATKVLTKITYLHDDVKTLTMDGYDGYSNGSYFFGEGLPLYTRYLKKYAGVDPETGESLWYKNKKDESGEITGQETTNQYSLADYYLGDNPTPDWYGGIGTSLYFHGFDFSINTSYQIGGKSFDSGYQNFMAPPTQGNTGNTYHVDYAKAWSATNKDSDIPRWQYADNNAASTSDRFLTDASYLNIENINFGYTFPSQLTSKVGIQAFRIFASCENVAYWSVRKGFDPRGSFTGGTSYTSYLPIRTFSAGISLKF
ncbi:MAG: SusC/RagA family TonB-linked outer membrane protein [Bacteroidales bacterium]|nr:SusC/RagA family TonB-linked outer membrane protein [Bacteroidales bacterium]